MTLNVVSHLLCQLANGRQIELCPILGLPSHFFLIVARLQTRPPVLWVVQCSTDTGSQIPASVEDDGRAELVARIVPCSLRALCVVQCSADICLQSLASVEEDGRAELFARVMQCRLPRLCVVQCSKDICLQSVLSACVEDDGRLLA